MLYIVMDVPFTTITTPRCWPLAADDTLGMNQFNPGYGGSVCLSVWRRGEALGVAAVVGAELMVLCCWSGTPVAFPLRLL